ncbi:MAG: 23S rRNA (uracil(1939)-C(5))-methyltransferase RlmD [Christensenellaceae bacterium]|jgi:23S rRNA (uracil1939-C5)-methyltransferase|nr:23S rRNA (uracil(1939)-C(5))-methyltransferase RlmD [Christensenellaceae bacterium]
MKINTPVQKNEDISLHIDSLTAQGQGIGKVDGFAMFVPQALPGEDVDAHVIKVHTGYGIAKLKAVRNPSPNRAAPRCPVYAQCGGCTLQHVRYEAQLAAKHAQVQDAIRRLGGFTDVKVEPVLGMTEPWRYRNKGSFPLGSGGSGVVMGFYAPHSHRIVPMEDCPIQDARGIAAACAVRDWAEQYGIAPYDEATQRGDLRHVMARTSAQGVMAVIVTTGKLPQRDALVANLKKRVPDLACVLHNINRTASNVILGGEYALVYGAARLETNIGGLRFDVSAQSFLQVNPTQTEALYQTVLSFLNLNGEETVADVYCGIGAISLLLAKAAKKVIGIDNVAEAVEDARRNAAQNDIRNAEFICGNAEDALPALVAQGAALQAIVVDPPRKGCEQAALQAILRSGAKRVVYVSCDPATLARDCRILADGGLRIARVQPVDMFPHTGHVETVVLLEKI